MQQNESAKPLPFNDPAHWDKMVATYEAQSQPFTTLFADAAIATLPKIGRAHV